MSEDSANKYFIIPTALGRAMIADSIQTGADINLSMVAVGDADYVPAGGQTELMSERARVAVTDVIRDPANPALLRVRAVLPPDMGGWRIHEVGIFAKNGNLFAVGRMDGSYKPLYTDGMAKEVALDLILEVGAEAGFNLVIDPHAIIATRQWVLEQLGPLQSLWRQHISDKNNPHGMGIPQIPGLPEELDGRPKTVFLTQEEYDALGDEKQDDTL
jgi:phage-related tail fiber protein